MDSVAEDTGRRALLLQSRRHPRRSRPPGRGPWAARVLAVGVAVLFVAPTAYLVVAGLGEQQVLATLASRRLLVPLRNTLVLAALVSTGAAVVGTATAWLVTRTDVPGRRVWRALLPLPLVIPSFIGAFAVSAAFAPGGLVPRVLATLGTAPTLNVRGMPWAVAVLTGLTYPYVYLPVAARLHQLPPSLEDAARLLGRRPRQVFRDIVLPQIRSAVLAGTLLVFLYCVSEFGAVELLRVDTLTRSVFTAYKSFDGPAAVALSLGLGVLATTVVILERTAAHAPARVADTATRGRQLPLGRLRAAAVGVLVAVLGFALFAPVSVLAYWAIRGLRAPSTRASALAADPTALLAPAWNTARVSLAAAALSILVVLPIAYLTVRYRDRIGNVANALVVGGFALPGLAIALAFVYWTVGGAVYQTVGLLVVAYVVHFGAQSLRAAEVAVANVPLQLEEAARALGAERPRRMRTVELPLMRPGLLAGGGLVLLSSMKELPATLLLAPPGFQTLATKVWQSTQDAFLADASIGSLLLILLSGCLTWLLVVRRSEAL